MTIRVISNHLILVEAQGETAKGAHEKPTTLAPSSKSCPPSTDDNTSDF